MSQIALRRDLKNKSTASPPSPPREMKKQSLERTTSTSEISGNKDSNVIPFNLQLKKLAKARNWRGALKCVEEIHKHGLKPDEISYATAIDACSKALKSKEAVRLFEEMKTGGLRPGVPMYNAVMSACARDHQWKKSLAFLEEMRNNDITPNIVSYNVCLSALEKAKKWNIAVELMQEMRSSGVNLQTITYNTVISACAKARKMNVCVKIYKLMEQDGFRPDAFTYSSILNGYRKSRDWVSMFRVVDEMKTENVPLDAAIYSTVIGACADAKEFKRAFELFNEMKFNGVRPNPIVYSCILRACTDVRMVDTLLNDMRMEGIQRNSVVFTSAINVAHKCGEVGYATRWFDQMLCEGIKPDWVAYVSLFEVLSSTNDSQLLERYYTKGLVSGVIRHVSKDSTDTMLVVDLNGWSMALARAALRHVMKDLRKSYREGTFVKGLTILIGKGYSKGNHSVLRPAIARMFETEFNPTLQYDTHSSGKITVDRENILKWLQKQKSPRAGSPRSSQKNYLSSFSFGNHVRPPQRYEQMGSPAPSAHVDGLYFPAPHPHHQSSYGGHSPHGLRSYSNFSPPMYFSKQQLHIPQPRDYHHYESCRYDVHDPLYKFYGELLGRDDSPPLGHTTAWRGVAGC